MGSSTLLVQLVNDFMITFSLKVSPLLLLLHDVPLLRFSGKSRRGKPDSKSFDAPLYGPWIQTARASLDSFNVLAGKSVVSMFATSKRCLVG